jgi:hypothetical protein
MRILPLVLFLVSCGSAGGQSAGYTLRFETLTETVPSGNDQVPARVMPFGDGWVAFNYELSLSDGAGGWTAVRTLDHSLGGTVLDGTLFALVDGGVASSNDGVTFTSVSDRPLTGIAAVGGTLLGIESVDSFSVQVLRSNDRGASWTPTGVVVTKTLIEIGSFDGMFVGAGPDAAWARFTADADLGDNVDFDTEL